MKLQNGRINNLKTLKIYFLDFGFFEKIFDVFKILKNTMTLCSSFYFYC